VSDMLIKAGHDSQAVSGQIFGLVEQFQFQDRAKQQLQSIINVMTMFHDELSAVKQRHNLFGRDDLKDEAFLAQMQQGYTMAQQHEVHQEGSASTSVGNEEIELFGGGDEAPAQQADNSTADDDIFFDEPATATADQPVETAPVEAPATDDDALFDAAATNTPAPVEAIIEEPTAAPVPPAAPTPAVEATPAATGDKPPVAKEIYTPEPLAPAAPPAEKPRAAAGGAPLGGNVDLF